MSCFASSKDASTCQQTCQQTCNSKTLKEIAIIREKVTSMIPYEQKLSDSEFFLEAIKIKPSILSKMPKALITFELCLAAVQNGGKFYDVPESFRTYELCVLAIQKNSGAISYVPPHLQTDELFLMAVEKHGYSLKYIPEHLKTYDLCWQCVEKDPLALCGVPENLKTFELCFLAVKYGHPWIMGFVPAQFKDKIQYQLQNELYDSEDE